MKSPRPKTKQSLNLTQSRIEPLLSIVFKNLLYIGYNFSSLRGGMRNHRGSAFVFLLIMTMITAGLISSMGLYVLNYSTLVTKTKNIGLLQSILHSSMDYTLNGVRNKWCFSSSWTPSSTCSLTDPNNVERLLLSDEALRAIELSMNPISYGGNISKVRTKSFSTNIKLSQITEDHPLYSVNKGIKDFGDDVSFDFRITRIDNGLAKGREVALEVQVDFNLGSNLAAKLSKPALTLVSTVLVFPRELSTNTLVVANNLFLDRPDPGVDAGNPGNSYIAPSLGNATGASGLRFESPVFVNNNIYVPARNSPIYLPVTFADKVIVGGGLVLEANQTGATADFYTPDTAGGKNDRYLSQMKNFGGFLGGVLLDPGSDPGLNILAGVVTPATNPNVDVNLCLKRNNSKVDLSITRDAQLYMKYVTAGSNEAPATATSAVNSNYNFVLDLGSVDSFYMQGATGNNQFKSYTPNELQPNVQLNDADSSDRRPIMRVSLSIDGFKAKTGAFVTADISRNSILEIPMNSADSAAKIVIKTTPVVRGGNIQSQAVNVSVELLKQEAFDIKTVPVQVTGATIASKLPPKIDVRFESFEVAYDFDNPKIVSKRTKGSPLDPLAPDNCPFSTDPAAPYNSDVKVFNGVTYRCYSQFTWHPEIGKYKANGFSLLRTTDDAQTAFALQKTTSDVFVACTSLNAANCTIYDDALKPMDTDFVEFDKNCNAPPTGTDLFPSFGAASWDSATFLDQTRHSWGFTEPGAPDPANGNKVTAGFNPGTFIFDEGNSLFNPPVYPVFNVRAIFKTCLIKAGANFVTGFLVCDRLIIEPRTTPLRIIGTFIVGKMSIDKTAIESGIRWSNIYHPSAVYELRKAKVLKADLIKNGVQILPQESCDVPADPLWQPYPSIYRAQFLYKCNPLTLRNKADPFKWTMVDPDCGLSPTGVQQCKYHPVRYQIIEIRRQEIL